MTLRMLLGWVDRIYSLCLLWNILQNKVKHIEKCKNAKKRVRMRSFGFHRREVLSWEFNRTSSWRQKNVKKQRKNEEKRATSRKRRIGPSRELPKSSRGKKREKGGKRESLEIRKKRKKCKNTVSKGFLRPPQEVLRRSEKGENEGKRGKTREFRN